MKSINIRGRLFSLEKPAVMGIINVTPDSFHAPSRTAPAEAARRAAEMVAEGARMLDIGGCSTRPGAPDPGAPEELRRLLPAIAAIKDALPDIPLSVDTFRAEVARRCVEAGADIVNDIGGGTLDPGMAAAVAELKVPYILMHMRGTPATMQGLAYYDDVAADVLRDLAFKADAMRGAGVADIIIDPGFGFAKTVDQNYRLLDDLPAFRVLGCPLLVGVSRKTMVWKELGITPAEALEGTVALNTIALLKGAHILRVHDVRAAAHTVAVVEAYRRNSDPCPNTVTVTDRPQLP